jgi:hypothetical protein
MELEDFKEKLASEVEAYNELIEKLNELDAERQGKLARIQVLQELIEDKAKEPAKKEEKGVKSAKAEG